MKFSIIMPVYNAGTYLRSAIESVLSQSFRDLELIMIDDGATDGSALVCDSYKAIDPRVIVIHQQNVGICRTRNVGLSIASGDYIMFCDHDDIYLPDYLASVASRIATYNRPPDIVKVNIELADRSPDGHETITHLGDDLGDFSWHWPSPYLQFERLSLAVWDGAYLRTFLTKNNITFNERYRFGAEDFDFMIKALRHASSVLRLQNCRYRHYNNIGLSTSSKYHPERLDDILSVAKFENETFPTNNWRLGIARYRRWNGVMLFCGLNLPNCPPSFFSRMPYVLKMWRNLQPLIPPISTIWRLQRDELVFAILQRFHIMWLYMSIKTFMLK